MIDFFLNIPFEMIGWALVQFFWISSLFLAGMIVTLKVIKPFNSKLKYALGIAGFLALALIPILLFVEHKGILPPVGFADWGPTHDSGSFEPIIQGLPQITGLNLGHFAPTLYYWLGVMWLVTACLLTGYHLIILWITNQRFRKKQSLDDPIIISQLKKFAGELGVRKTFTVKRTGIKEGPAVIGIFHPYILIPRTLSEHFGIDELKPILLHELIHIKRKDYFFSSLQRFLLTIFFFQPLIYWLNRYINEEREYICDKLVTQLTNDSYTYGNSLVKLQLQHQAVSKKSLAINVVDHNIVDRLKRLKHSERHSMDNERFRRTCFACLIIVISLFCTFWNAYHLHPTHNSQLQTSYMHYELPIMDDR